MIGLIHSRDAHYQTTRDAAASYMINHQDEFLPFLPSLDGEDGIGATESTGLMEPADYVKYCSIVKNTGAWGGEPEIMALAQAFKIPIHVVQTGSPPVVVHNPIGVDSNLLPKVMISYHRRMYGLGEVSVMVEELFEWRSYSTAALQQLTSQTWGDECVIISRI